MRENYNDNLNHIQVITRTNPIKNLSADDYNKLPISIKQAIEFIYDFIEPKKKECRTCSLFKDYMERDEYGELRMICRKIVGECIDLNKWR